jgi:hypothetical protein
MSDPSAGSGSAWIGEPPRTETLFGRAAAEALANTTQQNAAYWRWVLERGAGSLAPNFTAEPGILRSHSDFFPITVDRDESETSYPCSLLTQYVRYPRGEMRLLKSGVARGAASASLCLLGKALKATKADRVIQWNSWLTSTNLLPVLSEHRMAEATRILSKAFPDRAILVKNVHGREDAELPRRFANCGYHLLPSRLVYFFDGTNPSFLARNNVKQDLAALRKLRDYELLEHHQFEPQDAPRLLRLYTLLYLEKHSRLNPQYTVEFVESALRQGFLEFRGLRHSSGRIDAVLACFRRENVLTTPFVGYDTTQIEKPDFYRLLVAMLLKRVAEGGSLLNYSSGAGEFKRRRGGEACLEFNALYTHHLPTVRRLAYAALSPCLGTLAGRLLSRFGR